MAYSFRHGAHARQPQATDAGLANLAGLKDLETLNIVHLPITDAALEHLRGLAKLDRVAPRHLPPRACARTATRPTPGAPPSNPR